MSTSERQEQEAEGAPVEDKTRRPGAQPADGVHEVPLFLRGRSDGRKGNAQDEKDEAAE
jgi:hypothetical protein